MADLRSAFLASHHILVKKLDTEALLPDCISRGLITLEEQELILLRTGSQKTDRFLTIIHRRGKQKPDTFDELFEVLSESSGQVLDVVLEQIKADSVDPAIQARFASDVDKNKPISQSKHIEDRIIESLSVNEVLPLLVSHGVVNLQQNESIQSRFSEEEKARELLKVIKSKGKSAYDEFVAVLLQSESQVPLGEWLKSQESIINPTSVNSEVFNSERFSRLLNESEESVHKLIADIAMKFYKLGLEEGLQAAITSGVKTVGDGAAAGPPPPPDTTKSGAIAEKLKAITDELPKDIQEETKLTFMKLFGKTSVFTISRESIQATCASIMVKHSTRFPSGWHQIAFIYYTMFQVVLAIRGESQDVPTENRESQVANFVGPTLVDLRLYEWMEKHGGMEKLGSAVEGEGAVVVIEDSSIEPEN